MKIQNEALAGQSLVLRYTRDEKDPTRPKTVTGDADGIFDLPDKDATFLLSTKGWRGLRPEKEAERIAKKEAAKPAPAPAPAPAAAKPAPKPEPEAAEEAEEEEEEEGPDIDGLRSKKDAIAIGVEYGIRLDSDSSLKDMKAKLNKEIYGE